MKRPPFRSHPQRARPACALVFGLLLALPSWSDTTVNGTFKYSWSGNTGWSNWAADTTNGAVLGVYFCWGHVWDPNTGWLRLGDGTPTNGIRYSNTDGGDAGVNHDGFGNLTGLAWGQNIGWVVFETNGAPRIDLVTGNLSGHAWCPNIGWLSLDDAFVTTDYLAPGPDTDNDGMPDPWENEQAGGLGLLTDGGADADGDGVPDVGEYAADTHPTNATDLLAITAYLISTSSTRVTWASKTTRVYRVEQTAGLLTPQTWGDSGLGAVPPEAGWSTTAHVPPIGPGTTGFFRVSTRPPLIP